MDASVNGPRPESNLILRALPEDERQRIFPHLELTWLTAGSTLQIEGAAQPYLYFVVDAVVSFMVSIQNGQATQVAMSGREGVVGASQLFGGLLPLGNAIVVCEGYAFRLNIRTVRIEFGRATALQTAVLTHTRSLMNQMGCTAVCNRLHTIDQQVCRFFLSLFDYAKQNEVQITHQEISGLLGVRREGITTSARKLYVARVIAYKRGRVVLLSRPELERRACDCYQALRTQVSPLGQVGPGVMLEAANGRAMSDDSFHPLQA